MKYLVSLVVIVVVTALVGAGGMLYVFYEYGRGLQDYRQLADYEPPVMTRVHAGDGRLLAEYAKEKRVFVPIAAMPKMVVHAFLSAEDKTFYSHPGIDIPGIVRATLTNIKNIGRSRRPVGASTITQQVAKNFLLTNEVSFERKIKEAILSFRIERAFSKDRILELYLNEIYLGFGSYGVAAAAIKYFDKSLDELTIAEAAFLAALPKAPNNYNPKRHPAAAQARRDWVLGQMANNKVITKAEADAAKLFPLKIAKRVTTEFVTADYFAEEVRRVLAKRYGEDSLYKGGLSVRTSLDPRLQEIADRALIKGLRDYDRRHGWRGPLFLIEVGQGWTSRLAALKRPAGLYEWRLAVVLGMDKKEAEIGFDDGTRGRIPLAELRWARPSLDDQKVGARPKTPAGVFKVGDVVAVEAVTKTAKDKPYPEGTFGLRQIPALEGAIVALDPHTGRVLAMTGGYSAKRSQFNRVTQAMRQPGSAFKPFVYLAALEKGYTPSTLILDAPFVIDQGPGLPKWRPANYTKKFYGPSTMRLGLEKSRNLMTVRLAQTIGMEAVIDVAHRFNIVPELPNTLSMSLGAGETTLLRLTAAYATLVNGGRRITPSLIDRIQDREGVSVYRHDARVCNDCKAVHWTQDQRPPELPDLREQVTDPAIAYQMVSMLEGVVQRGTGRRIKAIGKPLAGKTGTTNSSVDTWFIGFGPDIAVGVFGGFDNPRTLGRREQGASVAAPIFKQFLEEALKDKPGIPFRTPPGIRLVRVNATTGKLARPGDPSVILEAFRPGTEPTGETAVLRGLSQTGSGPSVGTGGLY